jgi:hypothetical protein
MQHARGQWEIHTKLQPEILKETGHLRGFCVDTSIILKWKVKNVNV